MKIYWPYLNVGFLNIIMFSITPREVWWAIPLRIFGAVILLILAAVKTELNRRKMR
jgi:hypothetical protein